MTFHVQQYLGFIVGFLHILGGFTETDNLTTSKVSAALITTDGSRRCVTNVPVDDFDNVDICIFLKLLYRERRKGRDLNLYTLFTLTDLKGRKIQLIKTRKNHLIFKSDEIEIHYSFSLQSERWTKICISVNNTNQVEFRVNYDIVIRPIHKNPRHSIDLQNDDGQKMMSSEVSEQQLETMGMKIGNSSLNITFCTGVNNNDSRQNPVGIISGVVIQNLHERLNINDNTIETCIEELGNVRVLKFESDYSENLVEFENPQVIELCMDVYILHLVNSSGDYGDQVKNCYTMKGRLLTLEETNMLEEKIFDMSRKIFHTNETGLLMNIFIQRGSGVDSVDINNKCPMVMGDEHLHLMYMTCITNIDYSFCLIPQYAQFHFYGKLNKFNRFYNLISTSDQFILKGEDSNIGQYENSWTAKSSLHSEEAVLLNEFNPFRRKYWDLQGSKVLMTLTHCGEKEFACTDGMCISSEYRCSGTVECSDSSDEEKCQLIQKKHGYKMNKPPPANKNETSFVMEYSTHIYNIADISTSNGIALVDLNIFLSWVDSRLTFWNPTDLQSIDCKDIWSPVIAMADGEDDGFQLQLKSYRSSCALQESEINEGNRSFDDAFMGMRFNGEDKKILYFFNGLITIPCRFKLHKYPFGKQVCNITFWADNAFVLSHTTFRSVEKNNVDIKHLHYTGPKILGDFYFLNATSFLSKFKTMVVIKIELQTLYGFHMLNSYIPSFLILVISYATMFFPISDFNERVMVSLTALLVLATLFTQANNSSARTSYFKYLDIWYVTLITFSFFIVIFHTMIRMMHCSKQREKILFEDSTHFEEETTSENSSQEKKLCLTQVNVYNLYAKILCFLIFISFFITYSLAAVGVI